MLLEDKACLALSKGSKYIVTLKVIPAEDMLLGQSQRTLFRSVNKTVTILNPTTTLVVWRRRYFQH
jgi:hypothetical protein